MRLSTALGFEGGGLEGESVWEVSFPVSLRQDLKAKKNRNLKLFKAPPRIATAQFLRRVNRIVGLYKPGGFLAFINEKLLRDGGVWDAVQTGKDMPALLHKFCGEQPSPRVLCIATDQEQLQLTGMQFAFTVLRVTGVHFHDYFHRCSNDVHFGTAFAGMMNVYWASTFWMNLPYGPWQSAAWFHLLVSQLKMLRGEMKHDDLFPVRFWPRILVDKRRHHETADARVGPEARQAFLDDMTDDHMASFKGIKVKPASWMSWQEAQESWDPYLNTRAMVLAQACVNKGLGPLTHEELFGGSKMFLVAATSQDKPPASKAAAVKSAKAKLDALKKKHKHLIATAAVLMCDIDLVNGSRLLALGTRSTWEEFKAVRRDLTTPEKCAAQCTRWSEWSWLETLKGTARCLTDLDELSRCGVRVKFPEAVVKSFKKDDPIVIYENAICTRLGALTDHMISLRAGSMTEWTDGYPHLLSGLLGDAAPSQERLQEFALDVKAWWRAKDLSPLFCT